MNNIGIKISKKGIDVKGASAKDLVYSSDYNTPKVLFEGVDTHDFTGTSFVAHNIPHNLGYIPGFDMWVTAGDTGNWWTFTGGDEVTPGVNITWYSEIDENNLILYARVEGGGTVQLKYHYLIFVDVGA